MKKFIYFVIIIFLNHAAFAVELHEALTKAYPNNAKLQDIRNSFVNDIETFSDAFSGFLPKVSYRITSQMDKIKGTRSPNTPSITHRGREGVFLIEQPLFNGGKDMANLKAAQLAFQASRSGYYESEQKAIYDLIQAYLNCYEAKEKHIIAAVSVKASKQQLELAEEQLKLGEATLGDLATAKTRLAKAESDKLMAFAGLQQANATFVKEFGIEATDITLPFVPDNIPASRESCIQKALKVNYTIDTVRHKVQSSKAMELASKAELLPAVSLKVTNSRDFNPVGVNKRTTTSLISLNVPIYSKGIEYSNIRKARNKTRMTVIKLDDTIKFIQASAISRWEEFEAAKSSIKFATQGVEAAQIAYDAVLQEEIVGSKPISDVFIAEERLSKAKAQKVEAHKSAILAAYGIKSLLGELTAKSLKLPVKYFSPEEEFRLLKKKLFIGS